MLVYSKPRQSNDPEQRLIFSCYYLDVIRIQKDNEGREIAGDWMKVFDESSKFFYYFNVKTEESVWEEPKIFSIARNNEKKFKTKTQGNKGLPHGWTKHIDGSTGQTYYWNEYTEQPQWTLPKNPVMLPSGWTEQFDFRRMRRYTHESMTS